MATVGNTGVSATTPSNILFGAGTYHKDLKFTSGQWDGTSVGATSGGGKLAIKGELVPIELDGALVKVEGLDIKQGGTASMEVNFAELSIDTLKMGTMFEAGESDTAGFTMLQDKAHITKGDYLENFGFVGKTADGSKSIIVIFERALCTSGLEIEPKGKENAVVKLTLEACAPIDGDLGKLPVKIYYPTDPVV